MNILQVNKFFYDKGGSETVFFGFSKELENKGHKVIPFSMKHELNRESAYEKYFINKIDFNTLGFKKILKIFYNFDAVRKLKKLLKKERVDVAHLHNIAHHFSPAIIKVLKKRGIPVVQTLHDYKLVCPVYSAHRNGKTCYDCSGGKYFNCVRHKCHRNSLFKSLLLTLEMYLHKKILKNYENIDCFIAPSLFMKNVCIRFGEKEEKIKVINNFLPPEKMYEYSPQEEGYLLYFGRLSREKGVETLIEAVSEIDEKLLIIGGGEMRDELEKKVRGKNLERRVSFTGSKKGVELGELIRKARTVVVPSVCNENMPLGILEALYAGKIVIASRAGGIPEIIQSGENGMLFDPGNAYDLTDKINKAKELDAHEVGEKAHRSVQYLNQSGYTEEILKIYNRIGRPGA